MNKLLSQWTPSTAAIDLIKLNGVTDEQIEKSLQYLKSRDDMENIDDIDGYDNWNAFFIVFCIKANKPVEE
ncbi:hypothetical protein [Kaarinaea lacus]